MDVEFFVQQLHCPGVNSKSKGHGKLSIHYCADQATIETIFRTIAFANQLSLYGAVANMCEEFETHQDRSGQPDNGDGSINYSTKKSIWENQHLSLIMYTWDALNDNAK